MGDTASNAAGEKERKRDVINVSFTERSRARARQESTGDCESTQVTTGLSSATPRVPAKSREAAKTARDSGTGWPSERHACRMETRDHDYADAQRQGHPR